MKRSVIALALALTMAGTLTACSTDRGPGGNDANGSVSNGSVSNGSAAGSGTTTGQVSRRYGLQDSYVRSYLDDGRYTAGSNGQVYGTGRSPISRDMTQDARNIVRDTGDALEDVGRGVGNAIRDMTGGASGTPSWEPDSSAQR